MVLMTEQLKRWTSWAGGPWVLASIVAVQLAALFIFALEPKVALGGILALVAAVVVLERPILGVGLLLSARLLSTGATVFVRVGRMGVGPFEPVLILCLVALVFHAALHGTPLWRRWPLAELTSLACAKRGVQNRWLRRWVHNVNGTSA